ncbi:RluA family pseudouridine synthase [bacterium]|nr:RluA family pseudouridine synthase [bacterium]
MSPADVSSFRYTVRATPERATVWGVLTRQLGASRALIRRLKATDGILLNGVPVKVHTPAHEGDALELRLPEPPSEGVDAEPVPLSILYEDDDLIVLDKPAGIVVHPTHGCHHGTLANGLAYHYQARGLSFRCHPVHRIDRDTSGLVVFARHTYAHQQLAEQLVAYKLDREYWALVQGHVREAQGVIEAPIARLGGPGGYRAVADHGQPALTHYRVLEVSKTGEETLVGLTLETGRTHQIRVHMAHAGHPLLADKLYGSPHPVLGRQALHARRLCFKHPRTQEAMTFEAPLPPDLADYVAAYFPRA